MTDNHDSRIPSHLLQRAADGDLEAIQAVAGWRAILTIQDAANQSFEYPSDTGGGRGRDAGLSGLSFGGPLDGGGGGGALGGGGIG